MAREEQVQSITIEAGGDLSANQYYFVIIAADGQVDVQTTAGGDATGILQNAPDAAGKSAQVAYSGRVKVEAGATIAIGDKIQCLVDGTAGVAATGDHVLGTALEGGADGEIISVLLHSSHILV